MQKTVALPQDVLELAEELGIGGRIHAVMEVTRELFPGPVDAETGYDPSWPDDRWITINVEVNGSFREFFDRQSEWYRRIQDAIPGIIDFASISISPR